MDINDTLTGLLINGAVWFKEGWRHVTEDLKSSSCAEWAGACAHIGFKFVGPLNISVN